MRPQPLPRRRERRPLLALALALALTAWGAAVAAQGDAAARSGADSEGAEAVAGGEAALAQAAGAGAAPEAAASPFAGLSVTAYGEQELDLATGVTTLPQGGEVVDRERGLTLEAATIRYLEGSFIEAEEARLSGEFGSAAAPRVRIELEAGTITASGPVRLERAGSSLTGSGLEYFAADGVLRLLGPVAGEGVGLEEAAALLLDARSGAMLVSAPYRYQDGPFELAAGAAGTLLALQPAGEGGSFAASSQVPPALLERLGSYLP